MALTDKECKQKLEDGRLHKLSDGGGLQLWVQPNGSRLWRLAYRHAGKQKLLALGAYPDVSLADVRLLREQTKKTLAAGIDPSEVRKQAKAAARIPGETFEDLARAYVEKRTQDGRRPATLAKLNWMLTFPVAAFGGRNIRELRRADIRPVLRALEARNRLETAHRVCETIGAVFRFAISEEKADSDPTVGLRSDLARPQTSHRAAVTKPAAFGGLLRAIEGFDGQPTTHAALRLMALLFPRPGEMRGAMWSEFDLAAAVWTVPAARMKMKAEHHVPLPRQALAILNELCPITGNGKLVFPSVRTIDRPLSETTFNAALRRLGYTKAEATAHGFRASASTLLNESKLWHADAIERQLAHIETNKVRAAYDHATHWDERVRMMQWWADYLDELKKPVRAAAA